MRNEAKKGRAAELNALKKGQKQGSLHSTYWWSEARKINQTDVVGLCLNQNRTKPNQTCLR